MPELPETRQLARLAARLAAADFPESAETQGWLTKRLASDRLNRILVNSEFVSESRP